MVMWQMLIVLCGFVWATCDFDRFVESLRLDSRRSDKYLDESKEIQVAFFQAKFGRGEQSNYIEHCFVVVVLITIFLQICHNKYQDLIKSVQELQQKNELLQQENKVTFEKRVIMYQCLKSVVESSFKSDNKYNTVNKKLSDSRKLVTALSKKVDELTKINTGLVNEAIERSLNEFIKEEMDQKARLNCQMSAQKRAAEDRWYEKKLKKLERENAQLRNELSLQDKNRKHRSNSRKGKLSNIPTATTNTFVLDFEPPPPIPQEQWFRRRRHN